MFSLLANRFAARRTSEPKARPAMVDALESRTLFSGTAAVADAGALVPVTTTAITQSATPTTRAVTTVGRPGSVLDFRITNVLLRNGQLIAVGRLAGQRFELPLKLTDVTSTIGTTTRILDLELGPINLNVLGLKVTTSKICLKITAVSGTGNLLGNLLNSLGNLLSGGSSLTSILNGLSSADRLTVTRGLTGLLDGALMRLLSPGSIRGVGITQGAGGACDILNLRLGPINLNLLGLVVKLDNCAGGPVRVDITGQRGQLLGDLVCGLIDILDHLPAGTLRNSVATELARSLLRLI
jgi:hypothetical protein